MRFFLMSQGSLNPKIRFLGQKVYPVAHTQSDYCGHPFRVSGFFPSTYHQGSAQHPMRRIPIHIARDDLAFPKNGQGSQSHCMGVHSQILSVQHACFESEYV